MLAGKEYGSGSSRDWAAKGPKLLGVRAVIKDADGNPMKVNSVSYCIDGGGMPTSLCPRPWSSDTAHWR